ncbi:unnamed protein product [Schistosoma curassoni]|uniref:Transmembrane protein n=1 Tax=Schistosoma curassoni TaxID=6186 RepID=A0A183KX24_9TREM|nr:unnamed protein product [Schistosoma curassoni]
MNFKCHIVTRLPIMLSSRLITLPKYEIKMYSGYSFFSTQSSFGQNNVIDDVQLRSTNQVSTTETDDVRRARLLYQSRKRGNLENGILLSYIIFQNCYISFLNYHLLYFLYMYLLKEAKEAPKYFQTDVLQLLQEHCQNNKNELRNEQPSLY